MSDSQTVISQIEELHILVAEIEEEGMPLSELFLVAAVIEKLPLLWREFRIYLIHKGQKMTLEDLIV